MNQIPHKHAAHHPDCQLRTDSDDHPCTCGLTGLVRILSVDEFRERFVLEIMKVGQVDALTATSVMTSHDEINEPDFDLSQSPEDYAWDVELSYWSDDE